MLEISGPPFNIACAKEQGLVCMERVLDIFRQHVEENKKDVMALVYLGSKLAGRGEFDKAQKYFDLATEVDHGYVEQLYREATEKLDG